MWPKLACRTCQCEGAGIYEFAMKKVGGVGATVEIAKQKINKIGNKLDVACVGFEIVTKKVDKVMSESDSAARD